MYVPGPVCQSDKRYSPTTVTAERYRLSDGHLPASNSVDHPQTRLVGEPPELHLDSYPRDVLRPQGQQMIRAGVAKLKQNDLIRSDMTRSNLIRSNMIRSKNKSLCKTMGQ